MKATITEEQFLKYEDIRQSGATNMLHMENVMLLTGLTKEVILSIMGDYKNLHEKYIAKAGSEQTK